MRKKINLSICIMLFMCIFKVNAQVYNNYTVQTGTLLSISGSIISISGTFTILGTADISQSYIIMSDNAKIDIKGNGVLKLSAIDLYSDVNMWDGIYIDGSTTKLEISDSEIKNAKNAINASNNATLDLDNGSFLNHFTNNYKNIVINNYNNFSTDWQIDIKCTEPLLSPYTGEITYSGIELNNVVNANIGLYHCCNTHYNNSFEKMHYGIKTFNCNNLTVYNCIFKNITPIQNERNSGIGILFNGNRGNATNFNLTIGKNNLYYYYPNKFDNCETGIYTSNQVNVNNLYNVFYYCKTGYMSENTSNNIKNYITYNDFINCQTAINCKGMGLSDTRIAYNTITNTIYGIYAQNITPVSTNLGITNNAVSFISTSTPTPKNGILVTNVDGSVSKEIIANISGNNINMTNTDTTTLNYGIRVQSSHKSAISNNSIIRTGNAISAAKALNLNGIAVETSSEFEMCNNATNNLGTGMRFNGNMLNCKLIQNINNNSKFGIQMDNAYIGNQGSSDNHVNDNQWINDIQHPNLYKINGTASVAMHWYIRNNANYIPSPVCSYLNLFIFSHEITSPVQNLCGNDQNLMYENVINNNIAYTIDSEENNYLGKEIVYNTLKDNPAKYEELANENPDYTTFYEQTELSNIGKIKEITDKIEEKEYIEAEAKITEVIPETDIEAARKTVYSIYLDSWAKDRYELTESEYLALLDLASKRPDLYGSCVFTARVMLGTEGNAMETLRYRDTTSTNEIITDTKQKNITSSEKNYFINKLYPNPANKVIYLNYSIKPEEKCILTIYDLSGREIINNILNCNNNKLDIDISRINGGVYYYKIVKNNKTIISDKLVIIIN